MTNRHLLQPFPSREVSEEIRPHAWHAPDRLSMSLSVVSDAAGLAMGWIAWRECPGNRPNSRPVLPPFLQCYDGGIAYEPYLCDDPSGAENSACIVLSFGWLCSGQSLHSP